jgi:thioredoxin 1
MVSRSSMRLAIGLALALVGCSGTAGVPSAAPTSAAVATSPGATPTLSTAAPSRPAATPAATAVPTRAPLYDPNANAAADIAAALTAAKADGRPVLIDFGADWCPDCVALSRMMETPEFQAWLATVHVVRVDVGQWNHNMDLSTKYGKAAVAGIPAVVLLSPDGAILGSTGDGRLASAASMSPVAVLQVLKSLGG